MAGGWDPINSVSMNGDKLTQEYAPGIQYPTHSRSSFNYIGVEKGHLGDLTLSRGVLDETEGTEGLIHMR